MTSSSSTDRSRHDRWLTRATTSGCCAARTPSSSAARPPSATRCSRSCGATASACSWCPAGCAPCRPSRRCSRPGARCAGSIRRSCTRTRTTTRACSRSRPATRWCSPSTTPWGIPAPLLSAAARTGRSGTGSAAPTGSSSTARRSSPSSPRSSGRTPIVVIPHGTTPRAEPREPPTSASVLLFGRLEQYKGVEVLAAAMPLVWERRPEVRFVVAGAGEAARLVPADPRVSLRARYIAEDEVGTLLAEATLVALPYTQASQSGVGLLAIADGVPVVVSDLGALPELAYDRSFVAAPGDPVALAEAIVAPPRRRGRRAHGRAPARARALLVGAVRRAHDRALPRPGHAQRLMTGAARRRCAGRASPVAPSRGPSRSTSRRGASGPSCGRADSPARHRV